MNKVDVDGIPSIVANHVALTWPALHCMHNTLYLGQVLACEHNGACSANCGCVRYVAQLCVYEGCMCV